MNHSDKKRVVFVLRITVLLFLGGMALSLPLWFGERIFPALPVFSSEPFMNSAINDVVVVLFMGLLCFGFFRWSAMVGWSILALLICLVLNDQNRCQAWVYFYALILLGLLAGRDPARAVLYLRIIIIAVYFWSGMHKFHQGFIDGTFTVILTELFGITDKSVISDLALIGYVIPFVEVAVAMALIFPRTRNMGCYLGIITHLFVLIYLGPWGIHTNYVVYPWNLAMIVFLLLLFHKTNDRLFSFEVIKDDLKFIAIFLIVAIMPVFNFVNAWDHYLSFSYYSDKTSSFFITIDEKELHKTDPSIGAYFIRTDQLQGGKVLDVNAWSMGELNVPFYPERRTFEKLAQWFCKSGIGEGRVYFLEIIPTYPDNKVISTTCADY